MMGFSGFHMPFQAFNVVFLLVFAVVIGTFVMIAAKSIGTWHRNNHSPRLTVYATVVNKRDEVYRRRHDGHSHYHTTYYVTFQVESGDRIELEVEGRDSGLLVEGDSGTLTFQGTRYLGFARTNEGE